MDQKPTLDRYHLIPRVLIFLTRGEEVLLIRGAPTKRLWANLYNGIGGHVERGETTLHAAYRELREETGLGVAQLAPPGLWLCGVLSVDTGAPTGIGVFIFRGILALPATTTASPAPALTAAPAPPDAAITTAPVPTQMDGYAQLTPSPEGTLEWVHPARVPSLPCLPDLPDLLPPCLAHLPGQPSFFALSTPGEGGLPVITFD